MGYYYYIVICLSALLMGQCLQFYRGAELNRSSGEKKKKQNINPAERKKSKLSEHYSLEGEMVVCEHRNCQS